MVKLPQRMVLLFCFCAFSLLAQGQTPTPEAAPANLLPLNDNTAPPYMGLYEGVPPRGVTEVDEYAKLLNRMLMWGHCSEAWDKWDSIDGAHWLWPPWSKWVAAMPGRRIVISVPVIPGGPKGQPVPTLKEGATGAYNAHFAQLAKILVQQNLGNSIIRLGWEWDGGWYPWHVMTAEDAKNYAGCWQQIVRTMKAVPGAEKLQFCWNGAGEPKKFPLEAAYPGDDVVDYVGLDIYDKTWAKGTYPYPPNASDDEKLAIQKKVWDVLYNGKFGIKAWCDFAKAHQKGFMVPEWGIDVADKGHGGGDNPYFVQQMYNFIQDPANNVYEAAYWDAKGCKLIPTGGMTVSQVPQSWALFQKLFSLPAGTTAVSPATPTPPNP